MGLTAHQTTRGRHRPPEDQLLLRPSQEMSADGDCNTLLPSLQRCQGRQSINSCILMQFKTTPDTLLEAGDKKVRGRVSGTQLLMSVTSVPSQQLPGPTHQNNLIIYLLSQKMLSRA